MSHLISPTSLYNPKEATLLASSHSSIATWSDHYGTPGPEYWFVFTGVSQNTWLSMRLNIPRLSEYVAADILVIAIEAAKYLVDLRRKLREFLTRNTTKLGTRRSRRSPKNKTRR